MGLLRRSNGQLRNTSLKAQSPNVLKLSRINAIATRLAMEIPRRAEPWQEMPDKGST